MEYSSTDIKPVEVARPKGARQIEAFSPKIDRRLRFYHRPAFILWLVIEANPAILKFCERPGYRQTETAAQLAEFWVQYLDHQEILFFDPSEDGVGVVGTATEPILDVDVPVRVISFAELVAERIWTGNWERMLPLITANKKLASTSLFDAIVKFASVPKQLSTIEREFSLGDPILVRSAVFSLLHSGRLQAPSLRTTPLSPLTPFLAMEANA